MAHNFGDIDKYALDQELRDRIRRVILLGIVNMPGISHKEHTRLIDALAHLQPIRTGTNIGRLEVGINLHWDNPIHSKVEGKTSCALVLLRQLIINWWDYLLGGTDESLKSDGQIENYLETLEGYVENGLENYVVVGDERHGFWLMPEGEYRTSMEGVR